MRKTYRAACDCGAIGRSAVARTKYTFGGGKTITSFANAAACDGLHDRWDQRPEFVSHL